MNRRSFTFSLGALASAGSLPARFALAAAPAAPVGTSAQLATASLLARSHNRCSPAMLQRLMRVDEAMAAQLHQTLVRQGVVTATGANGVAMATKPLNTHCITNEAMRTSNLMQKFTDAQARLRRLASEGEQSDTADIPEQVDDAAPMATGPE